MDTGILPVLISLATDGPYHNAEMRRACARIIANVSSRLAPIVAEQVGKSNLSKWMETVGNINDRKLRLHADRARESLLVAI